MPDTPVADEVDGYHVFYSSGPAGGHEGIKPELTGQPFGTGLRIDSTMKATFGFSGSRIANHRAPGWCRSRMYCRDPSGKMLWRVLLDRFPHL